jgi:hypothetical protein
MIDVLDTVKNSTLESSRMKTMPSVSGPQARLMAAAAHTPGGYGGVPQKVGQDFNQADTGTAQLKQAMKDRAIRRGGPPGKPDEATESPQEKMREKRLGIP